ALAAACGVNQRLLYRYFSSKASLQAAVFQEAIITPFQAVWLVQLKDRSIPFEQRLAEFYRNYYAAVLTRKWLRLFLFDSLAETRMAPGYFELVILELLETVVIEASHDLAVKLPKSRALVHEIGWVLHGAVSHLGIRRQVYAAGSHVPEQHVIVLLVRGFLAGFAALVTEARAFEAAGK
ncbi:MAG: TetR family transcriptional regulator, partial [Xanthobacteraceae bacterium]